MIDLDSAPTFDSLKPKLDQFFGLAKQKVESIDREYDDAKGSPVFTVGGKYTTRGWTEWTEEELRSGLAMEFLMMSPQPLHLAIT